MYPHRLPVPLCKPKTFLRTPCNHIVPDSPLGPALTDPHFSPTLPWKTSPDRFPFLRWSPATSGSAPGSAASHPDFYFPNTDDRPHKIPAVISATFPLSDPIFEAGEKYARHLRLSHPLPAPTVHKCLCEADFSNTAPTDGNFRRSNARSQYHNLNPTEKTPLPALFPRTKSVWPYGGTDNGTPYADTHGSQESGFPGTDRPAPSDENRSPRRLYQMDALPNPSDIQNCSKRHPKNACQDIVHPGMPPESARRSAEAFLYSPVRFRIPSHVPTSHSKSYSSL